MAPGRIKDTAGRFLSEEKALIGEGIRKHPAPTVRGVFVSMNYTARVTLPERRQRVHT